MTLIGNLLHRRRLVQRRFLFREANVTKPKAQLQKSPQQVDFIYPRKYSFLITSFILICRFSAVQSDISDFGTVGCYDGIDQSDL